METAEEKLLRLNKQIDPHPNSLVGELERLAHDAVCLLRDADKLAQSQVEYDMREFSVVQERLLRRIRKLLDGEA